MKLKLLAISLLVAGCSDQTTSPAQQPQAVASAPAKAANWSVDEKKDPLSDKVVVIARNVGTKEIASANPAVLMARCSEGKLEAYVALDQFLNSKDPVPVRYRFDQESLVQDKWEVSTEGTTVFVGFKGIADFLRKAASAKQLILEGEDFRGTPHRATFGLEGGEGPVTKVLTACRFSPKSLSELVPGLRSDYSAEMELFGPLQITTYKEILASAKQYSGPIDTQLTPDFALAAQRFADEYATTCKGKTTDIGSRCWMAFGGSSGPSLQAVFYDRAKGELRQRAGNLKRGQ
jgi:hypothetical protein